MGAQKIVGGFHSSVVHGKLIKVATETLKLTLGFLFCPTKTMGISALKEELTKVSCMCEI